MTRDTRIALFLMGELVAALRVNDPDLFKRCLSGDFPHVLRTPALSNKKPPLAERLKCQLGTDF